MRARSDQHTERKNGKAHIVGVGPCEQLLNFIVSEANNESFCNTIQFYKASSTERLSSTLKIIGTHCTDGIKSFKEIRRSCLNIAKENMLYGL
jgi:hypothetical protein